MLTTAWLETVVPIGRMLPNNEWAAHGAAVLVHKPPLIWLVTANHVMNAIGETHLTALVSNVKGGMTLVEIGKILGEHQLGWIRDLANDLAAAPIPVSDELIIKAIPPEYCLPLKSVMPSMMAYTLGYPYGLNGVLPQQAKPWLLDGIISGTSPLDNRIYTNAQTLPGNMGGPLLVIKPPYTPEGSLLVGRPTVSLAGIILETAVIESPKPCENMPRSRFSVAASTDAMLSMLDSDTARAIVAQLSPTQNP